MHQRKKKFIHFLFCFFLFFILFYLKKTHKKPHNKIQEPTETLSKEAIQWLKDPSQKNHIYISLTTSPKRISKIDRVLKTLYPLDIIEKIFISIPKRFSRNNSPYVIPDFLKTGFHNKVQILHIPKDLGPITKLIPAVETIKNDLKEPNAFIITIDDDTAYPKYMVYSILNAMVREKNTVFASTECSLNHFGLHFSFIQKIFPITQEEKDHFLPFLTSNFIEGFGGIAYRVQDVDTALMRLFSQKDFSPACFLSDDAVINFTLDFNKIHKKAIQSTTFNRSSIQQLDYGFEKDAIHRSGENGFFPIFHKKTLSNHYQKCYQDLIKASYDFIGKKFKSREEIILNPLKKIP